MNKPDPARLTGDTLPFLVMHGFGLVAEITPFFGRAMMEA
jgi:hypothetical protein